jgi:hypothetical protein
LELRILFTKGTFLAFFGTHLLGNDLIMKISCFELLTTQMQIYDQFITQFQNGCLLVLRLRMFGNFKLVFIEIVMP